MATRPSAKSQGEEALSLWLGAEYPGKFTREYRFHPERQWRFDFALPDRLFAIEVEGITREGGRHQRFHGFQEDCIKYAEAAVLGWVVLRITPKMLQDGSAYVYIRRLCAGMVD